MTKSKRAPRAAKPDPVERARALVGADAGSAASDRQVLEAYASWLFYERRILCHELYPGLSARCDSFVLGNTLADSFHLGIGGPPWNERPQPSTRARAVLELVGVDLTASERSEEDLIPAYQRDPLGAPPLPDGWPAPDAGLLAMIAAHEAARAAVDALPTEEAETGSERFAAASEREQALRDRVLSLTPHTLAGLKAKAAALAHDLPIAPHRGGRAERTASLEERIAIALVRHIRALPEAAVAVEARTIVATDEVAA